MRNEQKYKTVEARQAALSKYCETTECNRCRYNKKGMDCTLLWLADEYESLPFYIRKNDGMDWYTVFIKKENGDEIAISGSGAKGNMQSFCNQLNAAVFAWHKRMCEKEGEC